MKLTLAVTALLTAAIAATSPVASASPVDVASTRSFIAAANRLESAAVNKHRSEEASANSLISHISATCRGSLPASTRSGSAAQKATWTAFTAEAGYALVLAQLNVLRPEYKRLIADLGPLHWTDQPLNRQVANNIRQYRAALNLRIPDLCGETKAAARSNFSVIPASTIRFLRRAKTALPAAGTQPTFSDLVQRMKRYTTRSEAGAIRRLRNLEHRYAQLNSSFSSDAYLRIMKALSGA